MGCYPCLTNAHRCTCTRTHTQWYYIHTDTTISHESGVSRDMALVGYAHSDSLSVCMCRDSGNAERGGEAPWSAVGSPVRSPGPGTGVQKTSAVARARSLGTRGAGVRGQGRWTSRLEPRAWLPVPSPLCLFVVLGLRGRGHRVGAKAPPHSVDSFGCEFLPERPPRTHPEVGPPAHGPPAAPLTDAGR